SINIFGEKGIGKSRFIEDLLTLVDDDIRVVNIDIRMVRNSYGKFVDEIKTVVYAKRYPKETKNIFKKIFNIVVKYGKGS
ncbi:MAG: hypothetical protein U9N49_07010, partial [Campylobacterota bacterium]|nr:hypothetical protein [Campylobacterota bacterium]